MQPTALCSVGCVSRRAWQLLDDDGGSGNEEVNVMKEVVVVVKK
jgi:hypothetical protein